MSAQNEKLEKDSEDDLVTSHINAKEIARKKNDVPVLNDPIWERQNEINKSILAKCNQLEQTQTILLNVQESFNRLIEDNYPKLRDALVENSARGEAAHESFKKEQLLVNSDTAADLITLKEAHQVVRSELKVFSSEQKSLEKRLASVEAQLKDVSERLGELFIKMEDMTQGKDNLQKKTKNKSN